jgi:hypothetical protein
LKWERRNGTFSPLSHPHHGLDQDGNLGRETLRTRSVYKEKCAKGNAGFGPEGLSTLTFRVDATIQWQKNGVPLPQVLQHRVALG